MKKLSDRLQALIADSEIPLSDAWGKLIDDLKAVESQPPVAVIDQSEIDRLESGSDADVWPPSREEMGDILLYAAPQSASDSADREMLKRLAVIMSGSDSGGEIAALTVTAQSFVDRCKTLATELEIARSTNPSQPVMFIDGDISQADADKLVAAIREFQEETETPAERMARIIRTNPHPTNMCDLPKEDK